MPHNWRQMTPEQRAEALQARHGLGQPWHGPPHGLERQWYHLAASCYEHAPIVGANPQRMAEFEHELLQVLASQCERTCVWCILPTHYHALIQCSSLPLCREAVGKLHGRTSHRWNMADGTGGRKCWYRCLAKPIKGDAHLLATVNYIHHNPVHHRYVARWQDWAFSSASQYLTTMGREEAERIWREFPSLDMGLEWDREEW